MHRGQLKSNFMVLHNNSAARKSNGVAHQHPNDHKNLMFLKKSCGDLFDKLQWTTDVIILKYFYSRSRE